jgi:D-3-phosphoglycerate dehydrogenase
VSTKLNSIGKTTYIDDPTIKDIFPIIHNYEAIFTNPNKSKIFIGKKLIDAAKNLKVISTASTGTNHIDVDYAEKKGITVLALTEERKVINKISSTAEHAFALTMSSLRHVLNGHNDVMGGEWNYEKFIGRQMDGLTVGVIGYGRLGKLYTNYCLSFGSQVVVYDPYKKNRKKNVEQVTNMKQLLRRADIISFHVHVTDETKNMVDKSWFNQMKSDVLLVNTSRGEIICELDLVDFLSKNNNAKIATDVLTDEIRNLNNSTLLKYAITSDQVTITPHIGGMTKEAQEIAYNHAVGLLSKLLSQLD